MFLAVQISVCPHKSNIVFVGCPAGIIITLALDFSKEITLVILLLQACFYNNCTNLLNSYPGADLLGL